MSNALRTGLKEMNIDLEEALKPFVDNLNTQAPQEQIKLVTEGVLRKYDINAKVSYFLDSSHPIISITNSDNNIHVKRSIRQFKKDSSNYDCLKSDLVSQYGKKKGVS